MRLEDCTGELLGTLPPADDEDDDTQSASASDSSPDGLGLEPIRELLAECRLVNAELEGMTVR